MPFGKLYLEPYSKCVYSFKENLKNFLKKGQNVFKTVWVEATKLKFAWKFCVD
jgi:hypothetical protein